MSKKLATHVENNKFIHCLTMNGICIFRNVGNTALSEYNTTKTNLIGSNIEIDARKEHIIEKEKFLIANLLGDRFAMGTSGPPDRFVNLGLFVLLSASGRSQYARQFLNVNKPSAFIVCNIF